MQPQHLPPRFEARVRSVAFMSAVGSPVSTSMITVSAMTVGSPCGISSHDAGTPTRRRTPAAYKLPMMRSKSPRNRTMLFP